MNYPIVAYGKVFRTGAEFHEWIDEAYGRELTSQERLFVEYAYDNGYLGHCDYKELKRKWHD